MGNSGNGRSRSSYDDWAKRLCRHFFHPRNAGAAVTFFVDDELLSRLAGTSDVAEAVDDLVSAVRGRLGPEGDGMFNRVHRDCLRWERTDPSSCPPSLPLLAVTVLAAARMARSGTIAAHNYYARLRELLRLPGRGMPRGYDAAVPAMWLRLDWWLKEHHQGALGRSTIREHPFYRNIGYALSQALFRESDRRQLSEFYRSLRLRPGDSVDPAELLAYFERWAPRSSLSHGAKHMAEDPRYVQQLGEILATTFAAWDGRVRDSAGRQVTAVLVTLHTWPRPALGLAAECPPGFPSPAVAKLPGHGDVSLLSADGGWLPEIGLPVTAELLHEGVRLVADGFALELKPAPAVPLRQDYRLGCWTSTAQLVPLEPQWLLVAESHRGEVLDYLRRNARPGWRELGRVAPPGWFLVGEAVMMSNMPPMRFNYQQRVGRAGRRDDPLAVALTVCRGRSHDDYYFGEPDRITGDPPPQPYLDLRRPEILRRVLASELLRRAFRHLGVGDPEADLGDNIHGQFGRAEDWPGHRPTIARWVTTSKGEREQVVDALLNHVDPSLAAQRDRLLAYGGTALLDEVDEAAQAASPSADLSERLAAAGILPMFGFPTRVRYLYHQEPRRAYPWPPADVIDRDLEIAVTQFAPGAEVVKDKAVHTPVGVASWEPAGNTVRANPNPLGDLEQVAVCRNCLHLDAAPTHAQASSCPVCGQEAPDFRVLVVAQPLGFRTDFRPQDFDGSFEWTPHASAARLSPDTASLSSSRVGSATVRAGRGRVYVVNNAGRDFRFAPARPRDGDGMLSVDLADDPQRSQELTIPPLDLSRTETVALGAIQVSDVLLVGIDSPPPGVDLNPSAVPHRAAWYSLGFLLREAAVRHLDVQSQELQVGLRVSKPNQEAVGEVFLADALENGAGYCTYLGNPDEFQRVLDKARAFLDKLTEAPHSSQCDGSCYDCLRDYYNMAYHPLLDWRLARDMLDIAGGGNLDLKPWGPLEEELADRFAADFGGTSRRLDGGVAAVEFSDRLVLVTHPLEGYHSRQSERLARAHADARGRSFGAPTDRLVLTSDTFNLLRRPGMVAARAFRP